MIFFCTNKQIKIIIFRLCSALFVWHLGLVFLSFHVFLFLFAKCTSRTAVGWPTPSTASPSPSSYSSSSSPTSSTPGSKEQIFKASKMVAHGLTHGGAFFGPTGSPVRDSEFQYRSGGGGANDGSRMNMAANGGFWSPESIGPAAARKPGSPVLSPFVLRPTLLDLSAPVAAAAVSGQKKISRSQTFSEGPVVRPSARLIPSPASAHNPAANRPKQPGPTMDGLIGSRPTGGPVKPFPTFGYYGQPARPFMSPIEEVKDQPATTNDHLNTRDQPVSKNHLAEPTSPPPVVDVEPVDKIDI